MMFPYTKFLLAEDLKTRPEKLDRQTTGSDY